MANAGQNSENHKTRLGILFGGRSGEHEVSLVSAASVMAALIEDAPDEYELVAIGITKAGRLAGEEELCAMLPGSLLGKVSLCPVIEAAGCGMRILPAAPGAGCEVDVLPEIIFPLLHGPYGEDGTMQGLFEIADIPYIGCGVLASAVAMDKDVVKRLWAHAGLPVTPWMTVRAADIMGNGNGTGTGGANGGNLTEIRRRAEEQFGYPMFSKPANLGSSVGVRKIRDAGDFDAALRDSARYDRKVLVEKGIDAREIECAILGNLRNRGDLGSFGNEDAAASVTGEVLSGAEFYDYAAKYASTESRTVIPADIAAEKEEEIRALAVQAFQAVDGAGLARVDFFIEKGTGKVWINEINTMPGFTPISMYAKLWAASGVPFPELIRRLVRLGMERFQDRKRAAD
ncbi:MAG: D-alanine--D-alanine ligase [Acidobacteriota bacterium]|jgi:D-alanine-D-alanine ligase|nr:D-alanine--D-alanine ligase [Acidobacteriota bacterium]